MHIYGLDLHEACHHPEKFGNHRHSDRQEEEMLHQKQESYKYVLPLNN